MHIHTYPQPTSPLALGWVVPTRECGQPIPVLSPFGPGVQLPIFVKRAPFLAFHSIAFNPDVRSKRQRTTRQIDGWHWVVHCNCCCTPLAFLPSHDLSLTCILVGALVSGRTRLDLEGNVRSSVDTDVPPLLSLPLPPSSHPTPHLTSPFPPHPPYRHIHNSHAAGAPGA